MKVAHIFEPFSNPHVYGGAGVFNYQVLRRIAKECSVVVYAPPSYGHTGVECLDGIEYRHISVRFCTRPVGNVLGALSKRSLLRSPVFAYGAYYLPYVLRVAADLMRRRCDIVHIHNFSQFVPIIRSVNPRSRIVLHMQGEWLTQLNRKMIERRLEKVDLILACSEYIANRIRMSFPAYAKRCHAVYSGADPEVFYPNRARARAAVGNSKRLLYVGRISPEKGVHVLIEAFEKVLSIHPDAELEIVGADDLMPREVLVDLSDDPCVAGLRRFYNGDYRAFVQNQLSPDSARAVTFHGFVPNSELTQYYHNSDVFIFPSFYESLGVSAIEAMATGLPVVATSVAAIPEVVANGQTGILIPPGDVEQLTKAILRLLADDKLRVSLGSAGRSRAIELFSWEGISQRLLRLYRGIEDGHC